MFRRYGCGCVAFVTGPNTCRLIESCCDEDSPIIGSEINITDRIISENILKAKDLTKEESDIILDKLSRLIRDGHRFNQLTTTLRNALSNPNKGE